MSGRLPQDALFRRATGILAPFAVILPPVYAFGTLAVTDQEMAQAIAWRCAALALFLVIAILCAILLRRDVLPILEIASAPAALWAMFKVADTEYYGDFLFASSAASLYLFLAFIASLLFLTIIVPRVGRKDRAKGWRLATAVLTAWILQWALSALYTLMTLKHQLYMARTHSHGISWF